MLLGLWSFVQQRGIRPNVHFSSNILQGEDWIHRQRPVGVQFTITLHLWKNEATYTHWEELWSPLSLLSFLLHQNYESDLAWGARDQIESNSDTSYLGEFRRMSSAQFLETSEKSLINHGIFQASCWETESYWQKFLSHHLFPNKHTEA